MFVTITKIITEYEKEGDGRTNKKDPRTEKPIPAGFKLAEETIRLDEIKSARDWHKSPLQEKEVKGDVTAVYMLDADRAKGVRNKPAEIHIAENFKDFSARIGAVALNEKV